MLRKVPLIVILGSTGTGKTKLSLELAEKFGGEIISADSMQVYANLDIATAKATKEERSRVKHHLLDVSTPTEPYTVVHFRNAALPIIENLLAQSKCPIVVGGTNYYIESLLWNTLVSQLKTEGKCEVEDEARTSKTVLSVNVENPLADVDMKNMSSAALHDHLKGIDPDYANRIHPNNRRKIIRALEVYEENGQTLSSILKEQRQQPGGNRLGGPLRYPHTILLWLRCKQDILDERLDKRVDAMLEQGLLAEIRAYHDEHKCDKSSANNSYTKGVLQTIGFKEFIPYLEQFNAANDQKIEEYLKLNAYKMPTEEHFSSSSTVTNTTTTTTSIINSSDGDDDKGSINYRNNNDNNSNNNGTSWLPPGLKQLQLCLNELKLVTRRYSKKQIKWINNRFLGSKDRQVPDLYELDTTDVNLWQNNVYNRAVTIIDCYRNNEVCEVEPMAQRTHPGEGLNEETSNFCNICQRHFIGEFQWGLHLKSNKHKRRRESLKKKEKLSQTCETARE